MSTETPDPHPFAYGYMKHTYFGQLLAQELKFIAPKDRSRQEAVLAILKGQALAPLVGATASVAAVEMGARAVANLFSLD